MGLLFLPLFSILNLFILTANADALYNVINFGAKPDGTTDSSKPFLRAWSSACSSSRSSTIYVPSGRFLITKAAFNGLCKNNAVKFVIDGVLIAPSSYTGRTSKWIEFNNVNGVSIQGGRLDGRGKGLWDCKLAGRSCPFGSTSLTLSNSRNVVIRGLSSVNSELYHIVILGCESVKLVGVNIEAAGNSPNTDGIHVQNSKGVSIVQSSIKTGDDCVSIGPGTSALWIERIFCGPGHGISIGSLGKGPGTQEQGVHNVTVKSVVFSGTENGLRIKTWGTKTQGYVNSVVFMNAVMQNVQNPIIIDQNYCPHNQYCPNPNQSSHVKVSQVRYVDIRGTSATKFAVNLNCSSSNPCSGISMEDIKLTYGNNQAAQSTCKHALGAASGFMIPKSCL